MKADTIIRTTAMIALDYWPGFMRSTVLCLGCAILQVVSCAITGYGFARFRFKLRERIPTPSREGRKNVSLVSTRFKVYFV